MVNTSEDCEKLLNILKKLNKICSFAGIKCYGENRLGFNKTRVILESIKQLLLSDKLISSLEYDECEGNFKTVKSVIDFDVFDCGIVLNKIDLQKIEREIDKIKYVQIPNKKFGLSCTKYSTTEHKQISEGEKKLSASFSPSENNLTSRTRTWYTNDYKVFEQKKKSFAEEEQEKHKKREQLGEKYSEGVITEENYQKEIDRIDKQFVNEVIFGTGIRLDFFDFDIYQSGCTLYHFAKTEEEKENFIYRYDVTIHNLEQFAYYNLTGYDLTKVIFAFKDQIASDENSQYSDIPFNIGKYYPHLYLSNSYFVTLPYEDIIVNLFGPNEGAFDYLHDFQIKFIEQYVNDGLTSKSWWKKQIAAYKRKKELKEKYIKENSIVFDSKITTTPEYDEYFTDIKVLPSGNISHNKLYYIDLGTCPFTNALKDNASIHLEVNNNYYGTDTFDTGQQNLGERDANCTAYFHIKLDLQEIRFFADVESIVKPSTTEG